ILETVLHEGRVSASSGRNGRTTSRRAARHDGWNEPVGNRPCPSGRQTRTQPLPERYCNARSRREDSPTSSEIFLLHPTLRTRYRPALDRSSTPPEARMKGFCWHTRRGGNIPADTHCPG